MSNQIEFEIPRASKGVIVCISNAAYYQKVHIDYHASSGEKGSFGFFGRGEDVTMKTPNGDVAIQIPLPGVPLESDVKMNVSFFHNAYTPSSPMDYEPSNKTKHPEPFIDGSHHTMYFMAEDATDNDFNDSFLAAIFMANTES